MKRAFFGLLPVLFLFFGCPEPFQETLLQKTNPDEIAAGMGRVIISLEESQSRTLFPDTSKFAEYLLQFQYQGEEEAAKESQTETSFPRLVELFPGPWLITVTAYTHIEGVDGLLDGNYPAASGSATVNIRAGTSVQVSVNLQRETATEGKGVLEYNIGLPEEGPSSAVLRVLAMDKSEIASRNLTEAACGSIALDEGYYLLQVQVITGRVRSKTEVIYIYNGYTTVASGSGWIFDTKEGTYLSLAELSEYLATAPVNTADNPYPVKLIVNMVSLSSAQEPFGQLFSALNGRYITLDLSDATGNIGNGTSQPANQSQRDKLVSVVLSDGVTQIGDYAFYNCTSLKQINFPTSLRSIGNYAFYNCTGLTGVTIPDNVASIGNNAFSGCTGLQAINVASNNTVYKSVDGILYDKNLTFLIIVPQGITGTVTIPDSVASIGDQAFYNRTGLTGVTIGNGVTSIGNSVFDSCTGLQAINVASNNTVYKSVDGILYDKNLTSLIMSPQGITGTVTIPDSVTSIRNNAFDGCTGLTDITIGNNVTSIGSGAFGNCANLTVTIQTDKIPTTSSNNWNTIFSNNTALAVIFGDGVTSIGDYAFSGCTGLTGVTIPDSVIGIRNYAFSGCTGLTSVTIPDSVTGIGNYAFRGCTGLTGITIVSNVTSIGSNAFDGCTGLVIVTFNGTITSSGFSSSSPFPGDLRDKYLAEDGGMGIYITTNSGSGAVWAKLIGIADNTVVWREGNAVSLTAPVVIIPDGETVSTKGWQISDTGSGGWTNFTPLATANVSLNGKYLRYYAAFTGGQTYYSNTVIIIVFDANNMVTVTNTTAWDAVKTFISNGGNNQTYTVNVSGDIGVAGSTADSFGTAAGITVTLNGSGRLYLTSRGSLITLAADQTLIINGLTLQGLKSGQNGATQENNAVAVVYVNGSNAQLELRNGTISGNSYSSYSSSGGGGVYVGSNGTFTMNGGTISGNTISGSCNGGGVYVGSNGTFTMNGGTISGNTTSGNGGGVYVSGGTFTMNGGAISGNTASSGGGVYGTFTMNGGTISGNTASGSGGGVMSSTFRIVTGTVYGNNEGDQSLRNTATNTGAALYNGGTAQRGTFSGETWNSAGSLSTTNFTIEVINGEFIIAGITEPLWRNGEAVSIAAPLVTPPLGQTVTAQGWQISDNGSNGWSNFTPPATAAMSYHGKYLRYYAAFSGGKTYYSSNVVMIIVSDANNTVAVTNTGEWDGVKTLISNGGNNKTYIINVSGDVPVTGSTDASFGTASGITVTLTGSGRLYLNRTGRIITLAANQTLIINSAGLTLQGLTNGQNGATQNNNAMVVYVNGSNAQLELRNGTISGNTSSSSGGGVVVNNGSFTMNGGTISGNTISSSGSGGGVCVFGTGTFTMNGGTISGNTVATYGGGVYVEGSGTFTMNSGTISGNTASRGGGVCVGEYVNRNGTFTMNDGVISGNTATASNSSSGGGVYVTGNGTFRIVTGTVYGSETASDLRNTASQGAALYVNSGTAQRGTFSGETWVSNGDLGTTDDTIVNGELVSIGSIAAPFWRDGNAVSLTAPAVVASAQITAQGWQISNNDTSGWTNFTPPATAALSYNGKYLRYYATVIGRTLYSNTVMIIVSDTNNTVAVTNTGEWNGVKTLISNGGNNQAYTINVSGNVGIEGSETNTFGTVSSITVTLTGSGKLYLTSEGRIITLAANQTLIIDGLTLQGLKNGQNGATQDNNTAAVYVNGSNAQLELRNGTISGNTSSSSGGGVYVAANATFTMNGGTISGNTSSSSGGGVVVNNGSFTMNGGTISGNTASSNGYGGGVYVYDSNGTFTMNGGTISGNSSRSGGGVYMGGGTFRIVTGTVYGSNEGALSNTAVNNGAALYGTAQRGTFNGTTWVSAGGSLSTTDNTIRVVNGALQ